MRGRRGGREIKWWRVRRLGSGYVRPWRGRRRQPRWGTTEEEERGAGGRWQRDVRRGEDEDNMAVLCEKIVDRAVAVRAWWRRRKKDSTLYRAGHL